MTEFKAKDGMSPSINRMNTGFSRFAMNVTDKSTLLGSAFSRLSGRSKSMFGNIVSGVTIGNLLSKGISAAANQIKTLAKSGIDLASDLNEVQNVVDTTFGKSSKEIDKWAENAMGKYGINILQAKQYTGTIGAMLKSSGIATKNLTMMSEGIVGLSGDMASFYNLDPTEAFEKIRSGISGETMPLKQLGINMSVANLQAYALTRGITKQYDKMTQEEQTLLRYNYLMSATKDAQGDFAKTLATSYANQKRVYEANKQMIAANVMGRLLPYLMQFQQLINTKIIPSISEWLDKNKELINIKISEYIEKTKNFLKSAWPYVKSTVKLLVTIIPLLIKIAPILISVAAGIKGVSIAIGILTIVQKLFNKTLEASTIGKIITIVFAVISVITFLALNWKTVTEFFKKYGETILNVILAVATGILALSVAFKIMGAAAMLNPFGLLIAGIVGLIAVIALVIIHWKDVTKFVGLAWDKMKAFGSFIGKEFVAGLNVVMGVLQKVGQTFMKYMLTPINLVMDGIINLLTLLSKIPKVGDTFKAAADSVQNFKNKTNTALTGTAGTFDYGGIWKDKGAQTPTPTAPKTSNTTGRTDVYFHDVPSNVDIKSPTKAAGTRIRINPALQ